MRTSRFFFQMSCRTNETALQSYILPITTNTHTHTQKTDKMHVYCKLPGPASLKRDWQCHGIIRIRAYCDIFQARTTSLA